MSVARARKEASKRLGLELEKRYRRLVLAGNDAEEITAAAIELGACFNDNIEFVIYALKKFGGLNPTTPDLITVHDSLPTLSPELSGHVLDQLGKGEGGELPTGCICPPLEAGIIGRDRHMTSCPEFRP